MAKSKAHSLTGRITETLMRTAFRNVQRNRGAARIDKVGIRRFAKNLDQNVLALRRQRQSRTFKPLPWRRVWIPKGDGNTRPLGIPAVRDRLAHEVLRLLLSPLFEPLCHDDSYGFRPARNGQQAVVRVLEFHRQGYTQVLDADMKGFFDNLALSVILAGVAAEVAEGNLLGLVERFLKAGVLEAGRCRPTTVGTPQGGVISPLLANSARNGLDGQLHDAGCRFVRSADDFVVLCKSEAKVQEAHALVQQHLDRSGLTLSAAKTKRTKFREGFAFLGFTSTTRSVTMRAKSVERYETKIRALTPRHHHLDRAVVAQVQAVLRGTANSFATSFSRCRSRFRGLDGWLRMRLRALKFKCQWPTDNRRLRWTHFRRQGFIFLSDALVPPAVEPT